MKKKVAVTRIIAAADTRISVVEFDLVGCSRWDDGNATLTAGAEGSATGTVMAGGEGSCGAGEMVGALAGGTLLVVILVGLTLVGVTMLGGTLLAGTVLGGTMHGDTLFAGGAAVGTFWGGTGPAGAGLSVVWAGGIWRVAWRDASGAMGRGT